MNNISPKSLVSCTPVVLGGRIVRLTSRCGKKGNIQPRAVNFLQLENPVLEVLLTYIIRFSAIETKTRQSSLPQ